MIAAVAHTPVHHPSCDRIAGYTQARSDRWRILTTRLVTKGRPRRLVACRRDQAGPAEVRILGRAVLEDETGSVTNGVRQLQGDRVLLSNGAGSVHGGSYTTTLVDLATGSSRVLGNYGENDEETTILLTLLTASGGLALASGQAAFNALPPVTPLRLWDAGGEEPAGAPVMSLAQSLGTGLPDSGIYTVDAAGALGRQVVSGPFPASLLTPQPSLRWQSPSLKTTRSTRGEDRTDLRTFVGVGDGSIDFVVPRRATHGARRKPSPSIVLSRLGGDGKQKTVTARLAPGSAGEVKVLGTTEFSVLVAGRFAGDPTHRHIRLLTQRGYTTVPVDIVSSPTAELPGQAILSSNTEVAISDGTTIRTWRPSYGPAAIASFPVVGARDLVEAGPELWYTDAAGTPQKIGFGDY